MNTGEKIVEALQSSFHRRNITLCLNKSRENVLFVTEVEPDRNTPCILQKDESKGFCIENPNGKEIYMLAVDQCFFTNRDAMKRCDALVFDEQVFCFVELKLGVKRNLADEVKEAVQKLAETIQFFTNALLTQAHVNRNLWEAYVVTARKPFPQLRASFQSRQEKFASEYKARLFWDDRRLFE